MPPHADYLVFTIALLALGVHTTTALVLLVLYWKRWKIRLYVIFLIAFIVWLTTVAAQSVGVGGPSIGLVSHTCTNALPVLLLLCAADGVLDTARRRLVALLGASLAVAVSYWLEQAADVQALHAYHVMLWISSMVLIAVRSFVPTASAPMRGRRRMGRLLAVVMLANVILLMANPVHGIENVLPVTSSIAQALVLIAALRFRINGVARQAERVGVEGGRELAREAAELDRLALLGELGAIVAHEVRNPLTGIRSLAQRLSDGERVSDARQVQFASLIVTEVDRLDRFVGSMLTLARREEDVRAIASPSAHSSRIRLGPLFDDLTMLVAARAAQRDVRIVVRSEVSEIEAPRGPVAQVLLNLLLNAVEQSPAGSDVTLEATTGTDGQISLAVLDVGPGIGPETRARLFESFAAGSRGTGLGLAVVRRVAQIHGWQVTAANRPEGGAVFMLRIVARRRASPLPSLTVNEVESAVPSVTS